MFRFTRYGLVCSHLNFTTLVHEAYYGMQIPGYLRGLITKFNVRKCLMKKKRMRHIEEVKIII